MPNGEKKRQKNENSLSIHTHFLFLILEWNGKSQEKPNEWRGVEKFVDLNPQRETQWNTGGGAGNEGKKGIR
jgi:hypothetical protein